MPSYAFPKNIGDAQQQPASIMFSFYERESYQKSTPADIIQLYMPDNISQPATTAWDSEAFGFVGVTLSGQTGASGNVGGTLATTLNKMLTTGGSNLASAVLNKVGGKVSAEGLMGEVLGKIPNPYVTMIFKGVDFRKFQLQFKFAPFSESACQVIDDIIKAFRSNALPPGSGAKKGPAFLGYPREVEVKYLWMGQENKWLHKFRRSVITGVDVNYSGSGVFSTLRNGFPATIVVDLHFSEIEIILRDDVLKENY